MTLARGCCSAVSPCSHQRQWPDSVCDICICQRSYENYVNTEQAKEIAKAMDVLVRAGFTITPPKATPQ